MKTAVVILAAGDGKRMKSELPKVMHLLNGKPLIEYVVAAAENSGFGKPFVVVKERGGAVENYLSDRVSYVVQNKQLGTGHALLTALSDPFFDSVNSVVVLYGDMPLAKPETIKRLVAEREKDDSVMSMATFHVRNHEEWKNIFKSFSRIIRSSDQSILMDRQAQDATEDELLITELNPCYFCFEAGWATLNLSKLSPNNAQKELYLTDLLSMAIKQKYNIAAIEISPSEAIGINTKEELALAEKFIYSNQQQN